MVAAAAPTDVAQDWGVVNPGGLGNGKGNGTLGSPSLFGRGLGIANELGKILLWTRCTSKNNQFI